LQPLIYLLEDNVTIWSSILFLHIDSIVNDSENI